MNKKEAALQILNIVNLYEKASFSTIYKKIYKDNCFYRYIGKAHNYSISLEN